ncbi:conserved hypothetical protein [Thermotomaculum hydrothermale]|uniref:DUF374 domain-containing protein n=1 Tax=Thermotomaculum hydrothermale TaxID=981385 RepID=A0A7R6PQW0_9BACT|nr:lysophospholipid acyltransferase family protein [Thermotomaculum hydrothermale]BBB32681.1 conserved hypothetical protein [Thermotomaculum hydrothermale]
MSDLALKLVPTIVSTYMKICHYTALSRTMINVEPVIDMYQKNQGFIYAFWHNRIFMASFGVPEYIHKYVPIISKSKDGEFIARTVGKLGVKAYARGSSSRYGKNAYQSAIEHLKMEDKGYVVAVTPDGPLGPKYVAKDGVARIALATGKPIVCFAYNASKKIVANSWDNFIIPLPCSDFVYVYDKPFFADKNISVKENLEIITERLNKVTAIADNWEF